MRAWLQGSAFKNKGVQALLDGVAAYLPGPTEVSNTALDLSHDEAPLVRAAPAPARAGPGSRLRVAALDGSEGCTGCCWQGGTTGCQGLH